MLFNNFRFYKTDSIVVLPNVENWGNIQSFIRSNDGSHVHLGKILPKAENYTDGAVMTNYCWSDHSPVFALPIKLIKHCLPNMAYSEEHVYFIEEQTVYVANQATAIVLTCDKGRNE
jgi:hypothetical protein